ncbi:hypothetical protein DN452_07270, partial [Lactobacillus reuteri]|uniref:hypothetical protein n=1 Tax=Limosilactobacillus reuteri TaxID=1598 RepID=UPI00128B8F52
LQRNFVTAKPINFYYLVCKLDRVQYPFCHEHYTFSAMHARKLADKDGQIHCYYCRKVLQQLH